MDHLPEEIVSSILANCNDGVYVFNRELHFMCWNAGMEKLTGYKKEEVLGRRAEDIFPYLKHTGKIELYNRVLEGECFSLDKQFAAFPEKLRKGYFFGKYFPVRNTQKEIIAGVGIIQEITKLVKTDYALAQAEDKYINLIENAPLSIVVFTEDEILYGNKRMLELLKIKEKGAFLGRSPLSFVSESNKESARQSIKTVLSERVVEPFEHVLLRQDGTSFIAIVTCITNRYMGENAIQAIIQDVTQKNQTLEELIGYKRFLNEAQDMARLGSYQLNLVSNTLFWSDAVYTIFEEDRKSFEPSLEIYLSLVEEPEVRQGILKYLQNIENGNWTEATFKHAVRLRNGKRKFVWFIARIIFGNEGQPISIVGSLQDITEQKRIEEELKRANQILSLHFENSPLAIVQLNNEFKISSWSKQAERLLGWAATEVKGRCMADLAFIHEDHQEEIERIEEGLRSAVISYQKGTFKLYTKNNTLVYTEFFLSAITADNDSIHSVFILLNDITSRKLNEEARIEGQLEERKRIARDIHDGIGQMLIAIKYKLYDLENYLPETHLPKLESLENMLEQTLDEARGVSKNLGARSVVTMGLETSLRQLCEQMRKLTNIDLKFRYIGGDQEINHKIVNAIYRIAQEASQNIVKHAQATEAVIQVLKSKDFIELKIEDNGKGIIMNGKEGNGLKNIEERVKLLGGRFKVSSEENLGVTLIVTIPLEVGEIE